MVAVAFDATLDVGRVRARDPWLGHREARARGAVEERVEALNISKSIALAQDLAAKGERDCRDILEQVQGLLFKGKFTMVQYAEIVEEASLAPLKSLDQPGRLILAVYINGKRLIDNGPLRP